MTLHINYEVRWKNFRAFKDTGWITIKPLTILIGANNSGKTSIISPLLMLSQTMASRDATSALVTRGPLLDLGIFKEFIHNHDISNELYLGIRYHVHDPGKRKLKNIGEYPPGAAEMSFSYSDEDDELVLKQFDMSDIYKRPFLSQTRESDGKYSLHGPLLDQGKYGPLTPREREAIENNRPVNFLFSPGSTVNAYQNEEEKQDTLSTNYSKLFRIYIAANSIIFEELRSILRQMSYIGPLRERLRRYYEVAGANPSSVGPRGQYMANIIRKKYPELRRGLNKWVKMFEFGNAIGVDSRENLFSLYFVEKDKKIRNNVAGTGFGASQVLPLIVQALTAQEESLTIAEQPEIHLNPRLQCVLADLFVEMANKDRRIIVETHSEHLLLRLRKLIADGQIDHDNVALYFVEKREGNSEIRQIPVLEDGHINTDAWPSGFFSENLKESIALAASQVRRSKIIEKAK